jgi:hypothetical protein
MSGRPRTGSIKGRLALGCLRVALTWALIPALAVAGTPLSACRCACCRSALAGSGSATTGSSQSVARCPHCRPQSAPSPADKHITGQSGCDKSGSPRCCCSRRADFDRSKVTNLSGRGLHNELGCALPAIGSVAVCAPSNAHASRPVPRVADISNRPTLLCRLLI